MKAQEVCKGCENWKEYGLACFYHWEGKRVCTQFKQNGEEKYREI